MCNNAPVDWDALQVFLAVARSGRVSAAAKRLGVEHTTVARRLAALEQELGVRLFYRTPAGYLLTPHGQNVLPNADAMEQAALAVTARAREKSDDIAGRVRVALAPEFASHWLVPKLAAFRQMHPRIVLQILVGTRERDLSRGEADLAVQSPRPRRPGLVAVRIAHVATGLYALKALVRDRRLRVDSLDALKDLPVFVYSPPLHLLQDAEWFQPILAAGNIALETNSTHALVAAARGGGGVAVLPRFVARAYQDLIAVSENAAEHDLWLTTHPEFSRDPRVRATAEFLKRVAAEPDRLC